VAVKVTRDIIEAYIACKTKAHLKLAGHEGIKSDYESFLLQTRQEVRQQAIGRILSMTLIRNSEPFLIVWREPLWWRLIRASCSPAPI
jgi:hypothetical protein